MITWEPIATFKPEDNALCIFYIPDARYVWASGKDLLLVQKDFAEATHGAIVFEAPKAD